MCGIYGEVALKSGALVDARRVAASGASIIHRGPDDDGIFATHRVAIGLRRLSIIDPAGGQQPIFNEDRSVAVVCNGEIYNFRELRQGLESRGHHFRTRSDAEVVVHLYEECGTAALEQLRGMFGLALWDEGRGRLLLARDRLGIKPVYYARQTDRLIFGSESKVIVSRPDVARALDPAALEQFLALGYVPNPHSLFRGIEKLPPGNFLLVEAGNVRVEPYWELALAPESGRSEASWIEEIRASLNSSISRQMVSDVPLGAFLSGGIDSSTIVAGMVAANPDARPRTYAIGYSNSTGAEFYNELDYARQVASAFNTDHKEILVQPDIIGLLPKLVWHMDEPTADSALITTSLVAEYAARDVKVILSGVGGDELWGGYDRYLLGHYLGLLRLIPGPVRRGILAPVAGMLPVDRHSRLLNLFRYLRSLTLLADLGPSERYHQLMQVFGRDAMAQLIGRRPVASDALERVLERAAGQPELNQILHTDLATQLTDDLLLLSDKMSMAHSLEARVPLLDEELVDLAARVPPALRVRGSTTRYILKKAIKGMVPDIVINRRKRGFGPPVGGWFKHELQPVLQELLSPRAVESRGLMNPAAVKKIIADHQENRADHSEQLFTLVTLEIWNRLFIDGEAAADVAGMLKSIGSSRSGTRAA
jgi:asparagine synthase (glutamine-hydrolysing)